MGDESHNGIGAGDANLVNLYPLSCYYFGSKEVALADKDKSLAERVQRMKANYLARGMRTCVQGVLLVELFNHPHVLLLQVRNSFFVLPGGRLREGESDTEGLKRKLTSKLSVDGSGTRGDWNIGECIGMWWKSDFETSPYPFLAPNVMRPKECTKLFLVRLPRSRRFMVPKKHETASCSIMSDP